VTGAQRETRAGGVDRLTSLFVLDAATPGATRRRHGRLAAALFLLAFLYGLAVVPTLPSAHRDVQVLLMGLGPLGAAVCLFAPWERLPSWTTAVPAFAGVAILSIGSAGLAGVLQHYIPLVAVLFAYVAVTQPPGWSLRTGGLLGAGALVAMLVGRQSQQQVEILGAIVALAVLAELTAAALSHARTQHRDLQQLYRGLAQLLAAPSTRDAARLATDLAGQLLDAEGAVMMLSEAPLSTSFQWMAGTGLGQRFPAALVDVADEASGVAQCVRTGERIFIANARESPIVAQRFLEQSGAASVLYVPVSGEGGVLGVLIVWWSDSSRSLSRSHDDALELLSTQSGQVLERLRAVSRLDRAARTDPLTGLGNRREFLDAAAALGSQGALLLLDLDQFKPVNDAHGHAVGDAVLVSFARALEHCVRGDVVCRIGGDEFAVVLRGGAPSAIDAVLRRMTLEWHHPHGVTYSYGATQPLAGELVSATVARADDVLYAAKAARHAGTIATY
jgi:diguanylate cyclase (GGDEF)-like protein